MLVRIGYDISFELANPTPLITMLYVHPSRRKDLRAAEEIRVAPDVPVHTYQDSFGNVCGRLLAPAGTVRFTLDTAIEDSGQPDAESPEAAQHSPLPKTPPRQSTHQPRGRGDRGRGHGRGHTGRG
jgi:hypothetical protein